MKITRSAFALLALLLVSILLITHLMIRQETRSKLHDFQDKGAYLVNLLARYNIREYETDQRDSLMRAISENILSEGFLYLFVHDPKGKPILSMAPSDVLSRIPSEIQTASLYSKTLTKQQFTLSGYSEAIHEFARPIFAEGKKMGTIRLGMRAPVVSIFSAERVSLLALVTFFIFAALIFGYYGILLALKPLRTLSLTLLEGQSPVTTSGKETEGSMVMPVIEGLSQSFHTIHEQLQQIRKDNLALSSRLGVTTFEKNQIAKILDAISFGIIVTDIQDNVVHINDYMIKLLRRTEEELIDLPLTAVLRYPEILSYISRQDDDMLTLNPKPIETALSDMAPGECFQVGMTYLTDSKQEIIGKMIWLRNVTSARAAEESQHQFIAHVAHELLTPLTNIKSYSEMLMDGEVADRETQREFYNTINGETDRLTHLVQSLLNISKMEMGSLTIKKGLVRTDWFVDGCLSAIEASAQDKELTIEKRLPDTFPSLMADKELLRGAIINILGNALKYTPNQGKITFVIADHDNEVSFEVLDTGYGIAPEDLPRIFDKFYRSNRPEITTQAGSGLGLSITSEIVRLHGGKMDVKSQAGEGTHIAIRIPKEEHYLGDE